jgi:hypothetical protein
MWMSVAMGLTRTSTVDDGYQVTSFIVRKGFLITELGL